MGFFKKSVSVEPKRTALTIISRDNKISGDMTITGKLHVDGNIEGKISSIEDVSIGRTGFVKGYIKAKNITVSGLLEGEVHCDYLHILAGGRVVASVTSLELITDSHSQFIGERRESHVSISDKAAHQAQIADDIDLDIIENLPNKITLHSSSKTNEKSSDKRDELDSLQGKKTENSRQDPLVEEILTQEQLLGEQLLGKKGEASVSANPASEEKDSLDDLGVLGYMEGLEFLDELDAQCEMQKEKPQNDTELFDEDCLSEKVEPKSESVNLFKPVISSIVRIKSEEKLHCSEEESAMQSPEASQIKDSQIEGDQISAQTSDGAGKIMTRKSEVTNSKKIDENTTKLELKF